MNNKISTTFIFLAVFALLPAVFPNHVYLCLAIGTVLFSVSAGLSEVLLSPVIAAIPADDPEHEMSKLHSIYAWGSVTMVVITTLLLWVLGNENWQIPALFWSIVPLSAFVLFLRAKMPPMTSGVSEESGKGSSQKCEAGEKGRPHRSVYLRLDLRYLPCGYCG